MCITIRNLMLNIEWKDKYAKVENELVIDDF
jgi:hypothetical protein